jgi:hypothetical protein
MKAFTAIFSSQKEFSSQKDFRVNHHLLESEATIRERILAQQAAVESYTTDEKVDYIKARLEFFLEKGYYTNKAKTRSSCIDVLQEELASLLKFTGNSTIGEKYSALQKVGLLDVLSSARIIEVKDLLSKHKYSRELETYAKVKVIEYYRILRVYARQQEQAQEIPLCDYFNLDERYHVYIEGACAIIGVDGISDLVCNDVHFIHSIVETLRGGNFRKYKTIDGIRSNCQIDVLKIKDIMLMFIIGRTRNPFVTSHNHAEKFLQLYSGPRALYESSSPRVFQYTLADSATNTVGSILVDTKKIVQGHAEYARYKQLADAVAALEITPTDIAGRMFVELINDQSMGAHLDVFSLKMLESVKDDSPIAELKSMLENVKLHAEIIRYRELEMLLKEMPEEDTVDDYSACLRDLRVRGIALISARSVAKRQSKKEAEIKSKSEKTAVNTSKNKAIAAAEEPEVVDQGAELIAAATSGNLKKVRELVEKCAGVGATEALMWAAQEGCVEVVQYLVGAGADVSYVNDNGKTALILSRESNHSKVAEYLECAIECNVTGVVSAEIHLSPTLKSKIVVKEEKQVFKEELKAASNVTDSTAAASVETEEAAGTSPAQEAVADPPRAAAESEVAIDYKAISVFMNSFGSLQDIATKQDLGAVVGIDSDLIDWYKYSSTIIQSDTLLKHYYEAAFGTLSACFSSLQLQDAGGSAAESTGFGEILTTVLEEVSIFAKISSIAGQKAFVYVMGSSQKLYAINLWKHVVEEVNKPLYARMLACGMTIIFKESLTLGLADKKNTISQSVMNYFQSAFDKVQGKHAQGSVLSKFSDCLQSKDGVTDALSLVRAMMVVEVDVGTQKERLLQLFNLAKQVRNERKEDSATYEADPFAVELGATAMIVGPALVSVNFLGADDRAAESPADIVVRADSVSKAEFASMGSRLSGGELQVDSAVRGDYIPAEEFANMSAKLEELEKLERDKSIVDRVEKSQANMQDRLAKLESPSDPGVDSDYVPAEKFANAMSTVTALIEDVAKLKAKSDQAELFSTKVQTQHNTHRKMEELIQGAGGSVSVASSPAALFAVVAAAELKASKENKETRDQTELLTKKLACLEEQFVAAEAEGAEQSASFAADLKAELRELRREGKDKQGQIELLTETISEMMEKIARLETNDKVTPAKKRSCMIS